ncbi:MAG: FAD-dependent thymidylate synthase [Bacteroidetes bacterium]|nr:MAG: FAD-dependent thymidylate synthase [Bacteroidota bacterium]
MMKLIDATRLLWVTPEAERLIVKTARVSAPQNEDNLATGPRLLKYLIKHKHWSPFEMANMCLEIHTQRDISAQIIRHRSFSFQEFSQRYAETEQAKIPKFRRQDSRNRQNSIDDLTDEQIDMLEELTYKHIKEGYELYQTMLEMGVAKETARRHLPMCSPTRIYMNGTLRSWIHYIDLRTDPGTQWEHRTIANQAKIIFEQQFPVISEALWYEA